MSVGQLDKSAKWLSFQQFTKTTELNLKISLNIVLLKHRRGDNT